MLEDIPRALATTSRWLLGLAFALAVIWKVLLSPDFIDGRFFRVTLLTDPRFAEAAMLIGGLSGDELEANRRALAPMPEGAALAEPLVVMETPRLRLLAMVSTWGIVLLESCVALVMLVPPRRTFIISLRHVLLLMFCLIDVRVCAGGRFRMAAAGDGRSPDREMPTSGCGASTSPHFFWCSSTPRFPGRACSWT